METILISIIKSQHKINLKRTLVEKLITTNEIEIVKNEVETPPSPPVAAAARSAAQKLTTKLDFKKFLINLETYFIETVTFRIVNSQQSKHLEFDETNEINLKNNIDIIKYVFQLLFSLKNETTRQQIENEYKSFMNINQIKQLFEHYLSNINDQIDIEIKLFNIIIWLRLHMELCIQKAFLKNDLMQCVIIKLNLFLTKNSTLNRNLLITIHYCNLIECLMPIFDILIDSSLSNRNDQSSLKNSFLNYLKEFLLLLINFLASYVIKQHDMLDIKFFLQNLNKIIKLVIRLMNKNENLFQTTMTYLINILKHDLTNVSGEAEVPMEIDNEVPTDRINKINNFLAELFKYVDKDKANEFIRNYIVNEINVNIHADFVMKTILFNFSTFLTWPFYGDIDVWCIGLMKLIACCNKYFILIEFYEEKLDFLLTQCQYKQTKKACLNLVSFGIINIHHSPKLFHQACNKIPSLLNVYKSENDIVSFNQLVYLSAIGMEMYGGYPEIYESLINIIEPQLNENLSQAELNEFRSKFLFYQTNLNLKNQQKQKSYDVPMHEDYSILTCSKIRENLTGLVNLGNTCYMNCILQVLYACKKFVYNLINLDIDVSNIISDNKIISNFIYQLRYLFLQMNLTVRPAIIIKQFAEKCTPNWFNIGQQQDCSEFLIYLFDNLNEELKRLKSTEATPSPQLTTLLQKLFNFKLSTECICLNCKTKTIRNDELNYILPLSFPPAIAHQQHQSNDISKPFDLQVLIDNYFKCEELSEQENNLYSCANCNSLQHAHKTIKLVGDLNDSNNNTDFVLPAYLILTLNRFQYERIASTNEIKHVKIMQQLNYNQIIKLNAFKPNLNESESVYYRLIGICIHSGTSLHHGHYYSYIIDKDLIDVNHDAGTSSEAIIPQQPNWLLANDEQLSSITYENLIHNLTKFKSDTPYLLVYEKITTSNNHDLKLNIDTKIILTRTIIDLIEKDNKLYDKEFEQAKLKYSRKNKPNLNYNKNNIDSNYRNNDEDDDQNNNGNGSNGLPDYCNDNSHIDNGPRFVF